MFERAGHSILERDDHAVVIGGGMAGLLAARVLSDHFVRVTVVEQDPLPDGAAHRKGVPQGRHAHGLLPRGHIIMEGLFPGLTVELISGGAVAIDAPAESRWHGPGGYRVRYSSGNTGLLMSRPFLEGHVRRRVRALPNVAVLPWCDVAGLVAGEEVGGHARVTGG